MPRRGCQIGFLKKLANRIRQRREELGITQMELAERVDCHTNYIGRIERAKIDPASSMLYRISIALNISLKELMPNHYEGLSE